MKRIAVLLIPFVFAGCASMSSPQQAAYMQMPPGSEGKSMAPAKMKSAGSMPFKDKAGYSQWKFDAQQAQLTKGRQVKPKVIYQGYLKLRVKRVLAAADDIIAITEKAGGYVESLTARVVVVRIPAKSFESIMDQMAAVGQLLDRHVKALDVTAQFTDLNARLRIAKQAQARLLALLKQVQDVEERLRILKELKRLSEEIESMESTRATLQNLIDYFVITIEFEPVNESNREVVHQSPFPWIQRLAAHLSTITEGKNDIHMDVPAGFVLFDKDDVFRAQAADTTTIRAGRVDNEPLGDGDFWARAVQHEMEGRDEELIESGKAGSLNIRIFRNRDAPLRYYLVGVFAKKDKLYVVEVFSPNQAAYTRHKDDVKKALDSFRVE
jgi:hypothetical protein